MGLVVEFSPVQSKLLGSTLESTLCDKGESAKFKVLYLNNTVNTSNVNEN